MKTLLAAIVALSVGLSAAELQVQAPQQPAAPSLGPTGISEPSAPTQPPQPKPQELPLQPQPLQQQQQQQQQLQQPTLPPLQPPTQQQQQHQPPEQQLSLVQYQMTRGVAMDSGQQHQQPEQHPNQLTLPLPQQQSPQQPPQQPPTLQRQPQPQPQHQHSMIQYQVPQAIPMDPSPQYSQQQQQQHQPPPPQQPQQQQPQQMMSREPTMQIRPSPPASSMLHPPPPPPSYSQNYHQHSSSPLYFGHNPFIEILKPHSYADDNIVTLNLSHSHIYEIDSDAFVGQRFEHIDLSYNKLGLIHSRSFRIGPNHSKHNPYNPSGNSSKPSVNSYPTRRPPPAHPKSVTIDFSHNPAIVALSGAFDHIDVPNCLLNFTNSTVELKFGAFKKYFKEHPGHIVDIESVDCCEQEWLLSYKHNFVLRTHCEHDPSLFLSKVPQQQIIDSCIAYVTRARHSMTIQGPSVIHQVAATPRSHSSSHVDNQYLTYVILGGTAMILTSLSIYIIFYMFSLKAAFVYQMQQPITNQHKS